MPASFYQIHLLGRWLFNSGAFMDYEGEVISTQGKKVVIKLDSLNVYMSVDLSKTKVEKLKMATFAVLQKDEK